MMRMFFNYITADFMKMKRLSILIAHIVIPIGIAAAFLTYYTYSPWDGYTKAITYYYVLGTGFPFLIGLFCAMSAEQELSAGSFQNMLSVSKRQIAFFSKLIILILLGTGAVLLASVMFGMGYFFFLGQQYIHCSFYIGAAFILTGSNVFLHVLHLFLALRFNKGVTIGLGIMESLMSALLLTGLGDGIWIFIPVAWSSRFVTMFLQRIGTYDIISPAPAVRTAGIAEQLLMECKEALVICAVITVVAISAFGVWAYRWDGICGNE